MEWSPNGSYVALTTNSAVQILDGKTLKLKWTRTVSGAMPAFVSNYFNHPDRAHFTADNASVWVRTATGNVYTRFDAATGAVLESHTFSDWTGDYVITPVNTTIVATKVSVDGGGTETLDVRAYDASTFTLLGTKSLTHTYVAGVDIPVGKYHGKPYVGFYGKLLNIPTWAVTTNDTASNEYWNVAFDPDGGILQSVVGTGAGYPWVGSRRLDSVSAVTWTSGSLALPSTLGFVKTTGGLTVGISPMGTSAAAFDYLTGSSLYSGTLGGSNFTFGSKAVNLKDGRVLTQYWTPGSFNLKNGVAIADGSALTLQSTAVPPLSGIASVESSATSALVSGPANFYGAVDLQTGAFVWQKDGNPTSLGLTASSSGTLAAAVYSDHINVVDAATGSTVASTTGAFTSVIWIGDTGLLAVKSDGSADRFTVDTVGGTLTYVNTLPVAFKAGGGAVTANKASAVGYANGKLHVVTLSTNGDHVQDYPSYNSSWADYFRIVALSDGRIGIVEGNTGGLKLAIYKISANKLVADTSTPYVSPNTLTGVNDSLKADVSSNGKAPVAAFFAGTGFSADGTPTSQLKIVRVSDGKVLGTYDNNFTFVNSLRFASNGASLLVGTGGTMSSGTLSIDQTGPQDLYSLPIPSWLDKLTVNTPSVPSGGTATLTIFLANKAPIAGTTVNLSVDPTGPTIESTKTITYGKINRTTPITLPAVGTDTVFTVHATIPGFPEDVTTTVTALAPVAGNVSVSPTTVIGGNGSTGTVTIVGVAPTGGSVVTLTSSEARVHVPATVTVPAGSTTTTFPVTTDAGGFASDATISAALGGVTKTTSLHVNATEVSALSLSPSTVVAGTTSTGTVTINAPASTGGLTVNLASDNTNASVPSTVTIPAGSTSTTFTVSTITASSGSAPVITATLGSSTKTATLTINQTPVSSLTLTPSSVAAGATSVATVTIGANASTGGVTVTIGKTGTGVGAPATVTIPAGSNSTTFNVTTTAATTGQAATVTATFGASSKTANLTITPTQVTDFTTSTPSVTGGTNVTGTITISSPAPAGGLVVTLANNKPVNITVPASVTVPAGATTVNVSFATNPTLAAVTPTITASISSSSKSIQPTINPPKVISVTFASNPVTGGSSVNFTVTLNGPAPAGFGCTLSSSNSARMAVTSPGKFTTGNTSQSFTATTTTGAATTVTLTASANGGTATADLTINP